MGGGESKRRRGQAYGYKFFGLLLNLVLIMVRMRVLGEEVKLFIALIERGPNW